MKNSLFYILSAFILIQLTSCKNESGNNKMQTDAELHYSSEPQLNVLNAAIEADPNDADLYFKRAKYFFNIYDFTTAQNDIQKAIRLRETQHTYWLLSAQINHELGLTDQALNEGLKALQLGNIEPSLYVLLARCYFEKNDKVSADNYLKRLVAIAPQMAEVNYIQAKQLLINGDTITSIRKLNECISKDPQNIDAYIDLMSLYYSKRQYDSIMPLLIKAKRMRPCESELYLYEGKFYESINRSQVAYAAYKEGLLCNPGASELFLPISSYLEKQGNIKESMNYLSKWLDKNPGDTRYILKMGDMLARQNDRLGAITYYKNYLSSDTANVFVQKEIDRLQKEVANAADTTKR